jgi:hypothetical protein
MKSGPSRTVNEVSSFSVQVSVFLLSLLTPDTRHPEISPSDSPPFGWDPGLSADDQKIGRPGMANV